MSEVGRALHLSCPHCPREGLCLQAQPYLFCVSMCRRAPTLVTFPCPQTLAASGAVPLYKSASAFVALAPLPHRAIQRTQLLRTVDVASLINLWSFLLSSLKPLPPSLCKVPPLGLCSPEAGSQQSSFIYFYFLN